MFSLFNIFVTIENRAYPLFIDKFNINLTFKEAKLQ